MSFSKLQCSKTLIFDVFNKAKTKLERKQVVHFPRRTLITEKRKSNDQYQTINYNSTKTFNESKNNKQTKEFLNVNENCPFETIIN
jgi:hypothetical protein